MHDEEQRFTEQWRDWVAQPPRRSPTQAAQSFRASLRSQQSRGLSRWGFSRWGLSRWVLVGAGAVMAVAITVGGLWSHWGSGAPPLQTELAGAPPALASGQVLLWLDEETPLYMTFQMPKGPDTGGGDR